MATDVETGNGSTFKLADGAAVLTELGEITGVMPIPAGEAPLIDASHFKSVDFMDYIQGPLADGEEADLTMNWIPGSATDTLCLAAKGKTRAFEITLPVDGDNYVIAGTLLVRDYKRTNPNTEKREGTLRVKWVGSTTEGME